MDNNKSFFDTISGVGLEEKAKREYKIAKRNVLLITFVVVAICGGILYFHFKGYNCTVLAVVLTILDILAFLGYLLFR